MEQFLKLVVPVKHSAATKPSHEFSLEPTEADPIPENIEEHEIDALLAQELNAMSLEERERTYEEIHGVEPTPHETPQFITTKLQEFDLELSRIPIESKSAYFMAYQENPAYVLNYKFRLMFLRSTNFRAEDAAKRFCFFFKEKLALFGPQTLCRSLYLSDLNNDDMDCLKSGVFQYLPRRDSAGRAVIVDLHMVIPRSYKHADNMLRALTFLQLAAAEDEETQKRGYVGIVYSVGKFKGEFDHELNKKMGATVNWYPLRLTGYHICYDDPRLRAWRPIATLLMGRKLRARVRFHEGTHTECRYHLMSFGIPADVLPLSYQGEMKSTYLTKWIAQRRIKDHAIQTVGFFDRISLPAPNDILLRRGRVFHSHPGNLRMHQLISVSQVRYTQAATKEKTKIAMEIVKALMSGNGGGRFLELDEDGWWVQVNEKEACKRVSKAIRTMRTSINKMAGQDQLPTKEQSHGVFVESADQHKRTKLSDTPVECFGCIKMAH